MKKNIIFSVFLLTLIISIFSCTAIQMIGWDDDERIVVTSDYGYLPTDIPSYFARTTTASAPPIKHYAIAVIYKGDITEVVASNYGRTGTASSAYASWQPAMPGEGYFTEHGYRITEILD